MEDENVTGNISTIAVDRCRPVIYPSKRVPVTIESNCNNTNNTVSPCHLGYPKKKITNFILVYQKSSMVDSIGIEFWGDKN